MLLIISILLLNPIFVFAHNETLDIVYDPCTGKSHQDAEDEMWYMLVGDDINRHIDDEITTISYYFAEYAENDSSYSWTTDIYNKYVDVDKMSPEDALVKAQATAKEIKEAYANSMKKWNDIYYYSYDSGGNRTKNKIINIVESESSKADITIYPIGYYNKKDNTVVNYGACVYHGDSFVEANDSTNTEKHYHYSNWKMYVNVNYYFSHGFVQNLLGSKPFNSVSPTVANNNRDFIGQHEMGHILGLMDIDTYCPSNPEDHHGELLMGYGDSDEIKYAKYKDIAGVAVARGFHTDEDHVWIARINDDGTKDVICAQCNGVRYNVAVSVTDNNWCFYEGKWINMYQSCIHYSGTNEDMLLVATDGVRKFYKCQYCRYIAEIDIYDSASVSLTSGYTYNDKISDYSEKYYKLVVSQPATYNIKVSHDKYSKIEIYNEDLTLINSPIDNMYTTDGCNITLHQGIYYIRVTNDYLGKRTFNMSITPPPHTHSYTKWTYCSSTHHIESCECGLLGNIKNLHVVKAGTAVNNRAVCMYCGAIILLGDDFVQVGPMSITKVTLNGSYILPNGIIVLVEEDIEAYENGTLIFYDKDKLPQTQ